MTKYTYEVLTEQQPFEIFSTMGCRTANGADVNFEDSFRDSLRKMIEGKDVSHDIKSAIQKAGRGNIAPATIILPTLAMQAKKRAERNSSDIVEEFMKILDKAINDAKDELLERYNWICSQNVAAGRFMYENHTMLGYDDSGNIESAIKHGTLAIGQLGLTENLRILVGCDHTEKKGMDLAKRIEQFYKDKCNEFKEKYHKNYGVYYSPCENTCYTAMKKFKAKYGVIPGVSDKDYFINSMHVDVKKEISPFEKIDIESQLTGYSSAGCITYVEIGDKGYDNLEALEELVTYAMDKDIPYFALNVRLADCDCGYSGYIPYDENCPVCGADRSHIQDYARITGYLSTSTKFWNLGKQAEAKDRYIHVNRVEDWKK